MMQLLRTRTATLFALCAFFMLIVGQHTFAQPYPKSSYQLSEDGKTLIKWKGSESIIDMTQDSVLNRLETFYTDMQNGCFVGNQHLTKIVLPTSLVMCDAYALYKCNNLKEVDASHCQSVAWLCVNECDTLTTVHLPQNNSLVGLDFQTNRNLKPINVEHLTHLNYLGFDATQFTEPINLNNNVKLDTLIISNYSGTKLFDFSKLKELTCLTLNSYKHLKEFDGAPFPLLHRIYFVDNPVQERMDLSKNLKLTGEKNGLYAAMLGCEALKEVKLPITLKELGEYAFSYCNLLSPFDLTKYSNLTQLSRKSFHGIKEVRLPASVKTFPTLECDTLYWYCKSPLAPQEPQDKKRKLKALYVPAGSLKAYQDAGWEACADTIIEMQAKFYTLTPQVLGKGTLVIKQDGKELKGDALNRIEEGTILTIEATPAAGYKLETVTLNGEDYTASSTFSMLKNSTLSVTFAQNTANEAIDHNGVSAKRLQADRLTLELPEPALYELFTISGERIRSAYGTGRITIPIDPALHYLVRITQSDNKTFNFKL